MGRRTEHVFKRHKYFRNKKYKKKLQRLIEDNTNTFIAPAYWKNVVYDRQRPYSWRKPRIIFTESSYIKRFYKGKSYTRYKRMVNRSFRRNDKLASYNHNEYRRARELQYLWI